MALPIITIDNSYSRISGLSVSQEKDLRDALSYIVGGTSSYFSKYGPKKRSLLSKRGEFPTGLILRVKEYLKANKVGYAINDTRKVPEKQSHRSFKNIPKFYDWQIRAANKALVEGRGTISATTGSGKSLAMALVASLLNVNTLMVVPTLELKKQLTETFISLFGTMGNFVINNIDDPRLFIDTVPYDLLMIDEVHHSAAKTYHTLNKKAWNGIYYRINFTATDFRNDDEETLSYESIAGPTIYAIDYPTARDKGYVCPIESYYIEIPKQETDAYTYREVYNKLVVNNEERNDLIAVMLLQLQQSNKATICLVKEVAHGMLLANITGVPFVHGADDESRDYIKQFKEGTIKTLIGTSGVLGEGVDLKPAEYIIVAGLGKAKSQFMQICGRVIRTFAGKESGKVIIIKDTSHKFLIRHFNLQKKILKEVYNSITLELG